MTTHSTTFKSLVAATTLLVLAGCGSSSDPAEQTGFLSLGISDGPIDAKKVCIAFTEVELKGKGAPFVVDLGGVQNINLLDFQGANAAPLLFNEELDAGEYQWLRLGVNAESGGTGGTGDDPASSLCVGDASYATLNDDSVHNLYIPSGAESGLKLVNGITIPANATANYTAEIDLMLSIKDPIVMGADAKLRPTVRLVNNIDVGTLTGDIVLPDGECATPSVYVFDDGVTPNPIETGDTVDVNDPIATAMVEERDNGVDPVTYDYTVGFLLTGNYEAAFTCDGENFDPIDGKEANISAGNVTTVSFD